MVTFVAALTPEVFTEKLALKLPEETVTEPGTEATDGLLLDRLTTKPVAPAAPDNVTVPVEVEPPGTVLGFTETEASLVGFKFRVAFCELLPRVAVILEVVARLTFEVEMVNVPTEVP